MILIADAMIEAARENIAMLQSSRIETEFMNNSDVAGRLPWLSPEDVAAVVHELDGGYADPVRTTKAYVKGVGDLGGEVQVNMPVRGLLRRGDKVTGVLTDYGPVEAGNVVNAAGPWSRFLAESAGIEMNRISVREQDTVWEAHGDRPIPEVSISNGVDGIYLRPLGQRRFVVGRGFPKEYVTVDP